MEAVALSANIQMAYNWLAEANRIEYIYTEAKKLGRHSWKAECRMAKLREMAFEALELELDTLDGSRVSPAEAAE
jgi:hypothetical protein